MPPYGVGRVNFPGFAVLQHSAGLQHSSPVIKKTDYAGD